MKGIFFNKIPFFHYYSDYNKEIGENLKNTNLDPVAIGRGNKEDGKRSCIITRVKWEKYWKGMMYLKNWEKRNMENDKIL